MKQIASAFVKAQKEFGPALKTATNPHFRSKYADLSACVEAVIDALNNNGIALIQRQHQSDSGVIVETVFLHESGEVLECGRLHVPASKQDPQGYGSALTYARRYSLMAACGIAPEDDDGNAASKTKMVHTPRGGVGDSLPEDWKVYLRDMAQEVTTMVKADNAIGAHERIEADKLEADQKVFLWDQLESSVRAAIKKAGEQKKGKQ